MFPNSVYELLIPTPAFASSFLFIIAILTRVKWNFIVVLFSLSLVPKETQHFVPWIYWTFLLLSNVYLDCLPIYYWDKLSQGNKRPPTMKFAKYSKKKRIEEGPRKQRLLPHVYRSKDIIFVKYTLPRVTCRVNVRPNKILMTFYRHTDNNPKSQRNTKDCE